MGDSYPKSKHKDRPIEDAIRRRVQILSEFLDQHRKGTAKSTDNPSRQGRETSRTEHATKLFGKGPVEWVIRVVRGLRNKNDITVLLILEAMGFLSSQSKK